MEPNTMMATVLTGPQEITVKSVPVPPVGPGELAIRVSACGVCGSDVHMWKAGREQLCREVNGTNYIGFVCNGAYAEQFVGKASNAYRLPDTVSDVAAGCIDPLMVAYHAVRKSGIRLHDRVLVVGTGIIGQLIGELAKKAGASYVALSKVSDVKTQRARELGIFDAYFDGNDPPAGGPHEGRHPGGLRPGL